MKFDQTLRVAAPFVVRHAEAPAASPINVPIKAELSAACASLAYHTRRLDRTEITLIEKP